MKSIKMLTFNIMKKDKRNTVTNTRSIIKTKSEERTKVYNTQITIASKP